MVPPDYAPALRQLLATHRRPLVAMLARRIPRQLCAVISAEDVAQEASLEAMRSIADFRPHGPEADSLWRWLCRIARHRLCDLIKSQRRLKRAARLIAGSQGSGDSSPLDRVAAIGACPAAAFADGETLAAVRRALDELPHGYRDAIELRYIESLSIPDAAARLGRTPGAVQMLCNRGLKRLRLALNPFQTHARPAPVRPEQVM